MRITVNNWCNVKTDEDTTNPRTKAEITIPRFRANLYPHEARALSAALLEAAEVAEKHERKTS